MANKRKLKQDINIVCADLFAECIAASLYGSEKDEDTVNGILTSIIVVHDDFIISISHPEPGLPQKTYFTKQATEIIDQINAMG